LVTEWTEDQIFTGREFRWAITDGDIPLMQKFLTENPFLASDRFPDSDDGPIDLSIQRNCFASFKFLIDQGFSVNPAYGYGEPMPLEAASSANKKEFFELLLASGANPNIGRPIIGVLNIRPESAAIEFVQLLIDHGCDLNRVFELYGDASNCFTALDWVESNPILYAFLRKHGAFSLDEVKEKFPERIPKVTKKPSILSRMGKLFSREAKEESKAHDEVIAYFEKNVGRVNKKALIEVVPTGTPIAIHSIPPEGNRKHWRLFTNGLSTKAMNVPEEVKEYRFAEIYTDLPGDWKVEAVNQMQWGWPMLWLRKMAQYPHGNNTWLGAPVTLIAEEEPPQPLYKGCPFSALFLFADSSFVRSDGNIVQLYRMIPLFASEREYEIKYGLQKFMQAMDKHDVPTIVDMSRKPFA
jgi:hypothetical protein